MEKPRIKLDIDGVLRNMNKPMIDLYNQRYNTNISEDDVNDYDVAKSFPKIKEIDGISAFDFFFKIHDNCCKETHYFSGGRNCNCLLFC